jgi:uridine kinase
MIGDPLILSEKDYQRSKSVIKQLTTQEIILIGGTSGSKKSELAYCLQKALYEKGKSSFIISLDDYYHTMPSIREINRKKMGLDSVGISEIDWESLNRIYEDFNNEREIHFKRTHKFLDAIEHNSIDGLEINYLIFEGLYANYLKKYYSDNFSIFLEGNPTQTLEFRKMRGKENTEDKFRQEVVDKEFRVVSQLKRYSDLILSFEK